MQVERILVTGCAGFIGMHVSIHLLRQGIYVVGIDNLSDYYDVSLKMERLRQLEPFPNFHFKKIDLADAQAIMELFAIEHFTKVVNLAAQPGVRYSLENPHAYINSNIVGFNNILEACRHAKVQHLVYASSSSVYGANKKMPFSESDNVDHPISLYAATKKANELMAHTYSHLFGLPTTGLRFFTVYGPWGRPDMSPWLFTKAIISGSPIKVFNQGKMERDFTYIDDIVEAVGRVIDRVPSVQHVDADFEFSAGTNAPYQIYNIGNNQPVQLAEFIANIETAVGKQAIKQYLPMQPGDVLATYADTRRLHEAIGFAPATPLSKGVKDFVKWFKTYQSVASVRINQG